MADLTKLNLHTAYPAFKNNRVYTGSFVISGTTSPGTNVVSSSFVLSQVPEILDILFKGRASSSFDQSGRTDSEWFKEGIVEVLGTDSGAGYTDYPSLWKLSSALAGGLLTLTATYVQTFTANLVLTPVTINYRIVDYSVF